MCHSIPEDRSIDTAGRARLAQLEQWVADCIRNGDASLAQALRNWRDEVITRLSCPPPQRIRIPMLFVRRLGLESQRVLLAECYAVVTLVLREGQWKCGTILVPRQSS
jgi:hypothetical protein